MGLEREQNTNFVADGMVVSEFEAISKKPAETLNLKRISFRFTRKKFSFLFIRALLMNL